MLGGRFSSVCREAAQGDPAAFELLYRDVHPPLSRYLNVMASDVADDAAADTWLEVVRRLDKFEGDEAGFRSWIFTIARSKVVDYKRRDARRPAVPLEDHHETLETAPDPAELVEVADATRRSLELIGQLPADQAEAVLLRSVAGLGVAEAAQVMQRSEGAVRVLSHRGLKRLASLLASVTGEEV